MNRRCDRCRGKGGWWKRTEGKWLLEFYVSCQQCKGDGKWWPNKRPKTKRRQSDARS